MIAGQQSALNHTGNERGWMLHMRVRGMKRRRVMERGRTRFRGREKKVEVRAPATSPTLKTRKIRTV